jgi:hypothetical protein
VINPNDMHFNELGFYPNEVYKNIPKYFLIILISQSCIYVIGLLLIQPFDKSIIVIDFNEINSDSNSYKEKTNDEKLDKLNEPSEDDKNCETQTKQERKRSKVIDIILNIDDENENKSTIKQCSHLNLKNAIFSKQNFFFFILGICAYCKLLFYFINYCTRFSS